MLEQVRILVGIMRSDAVSQRAVTIETQCSVIVSNTHSSFKKDLCHIYLCSALIFTTTGK